MTYKVTVSQAKYGKYLAVGTFHAGQADLAEQMAVVRFGRQKIEASEDGEEMWLLDPDKGRVIQAVRVHRNPTETELGQALRVHRSLMAKEPVGAMVLAGAAATCFARADFIQGLYPDDHKCPETWRYLGARLAEASRS